MKLKAWIISLNPERETVVNLRRQLAEQGIDTEVFPAVDGRKGMPPLQDGEQVSNFRSLLNRRSRLTSSELGCYLSHLRLVRMAYQQGLSRVCIFEDDVIAEPGLGDLIKDLTAFESGAQMIRFMSLRVRKRKVVRPVQGGYRLIRPLRGALGTQGYMLNREGMETVLKHGSRITMPIDKFYDSFFLYNLRCYSVEPHAIYEVSSQSSVAKNYVRLDQRLWIYLAWRLNKLYRSIRRLYHRLRNFNQFYPASPPAGVQGKSVRIR